MVVRQKGWYYGGVRLVVYHKCHFEQHDVVVHVFIFVEQVYKYKVRCKLQQEFFYNEEGNSTWPDGRLIIVVLRGYG